MENQAITINPFVIHYICSKPISYLQCFTNGIVSNSPLYLKEILPDYFHWIWTLDRNEAMKFYGEREAFETYNKFQMYKLADVYLYNTSWDNYKTNPNGI
jgi:hypothetical protein